MDMELCSLTSHSSFLVSYHEADLDRKRLLAITVSLPKRLSLTPPCYKKKLLPSKGSAGALHLTERADDGNPHGKPYYFTPRLSHTCFKTHPVWQCNPGTHKHCQEAACFNFPVFYLSPSCCNPDQRFVINGNKSQISSPTPCYFL